VAPDADATAALREPISPELALVSPELRARALEALPEQFTDCLAVAAGRYEHAAVLVVQRRDERRRPRLLTQVLAYAAWQSLVGFVFGVAVVATVAVALAAVAFAAQ
jgi:hypothetical protein